MWLERLELITNEKINTIINKHVLILGLGGVGSYAFESILRSGVKKITVIDNDVVDITNLNRQLMTHTENVGNLKTDEIKKRGLLINPNVEINTLFETISPENVEILFQDNPDYIIDACDATITKEAIIKESLKRNVKLISSMGTANKFHPELLEIIELRKTSYDPVAKTLRKHVQRQKIKGNIMVVCSPEKPALNKVGALGSTSFVPATAGLLCASYVINDILKEN